ncbi:PLP-dependent aminotransferase family protein [Peptoniphilus catoniae]|uniref:MocR-like pyridoxine biosynthesis transcription factor PdxR n=1 Tax=Peptoniphilus catoniae TaxID=1660341 RepID=UPI0010FCE7D9|nr:PLP-dependent aminotransferase family protein [Peptoniphilus catoniae]
MITIDFNKNSPLFLQIYLSIKEEIIKGNLKPDSPLPSKRNLANHLGVSTNTVSSAYESLVDEGYIYSKERVGFFVSKIDNLLSLKKEDINISPPVKKSYTYDFDLNKNSEFNFPNTNFKKIINDFMKDENLLNIRSSKGLYPLRKSIASYLKSSRAIEVDPSSIIVSSGLEYLFQTLLYLLPEDAIFGLENPGYKDLKTLLDLNKRKYNFIDIDEEGMNPKKIKKEQILLITPSHQFPTGSLMPVTRRVEILNEVTKRSGYLIEDDYDSEFKYYGRPVPALKSLDKWDRVIYISNFSKSISPTLRVSFMVLPKDLLKKYEILKPFLNCPVPNLIQGALSRFIDNGYFERHLNKMRKLYDDRRKFALCLFKEEENFKIIDKKAGLHFILEISTNLSEDQLAENLRKKSVNIIPLSKFYEGKPPYKRPRIILGFGNMSYSKLKDGINLLIEESKSKENL